MGFFQFRDMRELSPSSVGAKGIWMGRVMNVIIFIQPSPSFPPFRSRTDRII